MKKKAVVLLSGGLDSSTVLPYAISQDYEVHALSFDYGQKHKFELDAANRIAKANSVQKHTLMTIDLRSFGGSALTADIEVPKDQSGAVQSTEIPITYVPARNTIFLSFALALAEVSGAFDIFIGVNSLDYSGYPDCRPEFIEAFEKLANLATKAGVEGGAYKIHTPLLKLTKAEIVKLGVSLGVDYSMTHTCYDPYENGDPCGCCDACNLRQNGFRQAGLVDPLNYRTTA
jgi:7-cyano-7-deazaguanine synthase